VQMTLLAPGIVDGIAVGRVEPQFAELPGPFPALWRTRLENFGLRPKAVIPDGQHQWCDFAQERQSCAKCCRGCRRFGAPYGRVDLSLT
jgi:hypothetical protein